MGHSRNPSLNDIFQIVIAQQTCAPSSRTILPRHISEHGTPKTRGNSRDLGSPAVLGNGSVSESYEQRDCALWLLTTPGLIGSTPAIGVLAL